MKIAIIGAGFSGLSTAYYLSKNSYDVTVFESCDKPGGLALSFKDNNWQWSLEGHYHHIFASDIDVLNLARAVGQKVFFKKPVSSTYLDRKIYQLDSSISLLKFNKLNFIERLRTGAAIAFLKINPFWKPLEKITSYEFVSSTMGKKSWEIIWKPLFVKKFGKYGMDINAAWFWARIKKRSSSLGYPEGGFGEFAKKIEKEIKKNSGKIIYNKSVNKIEKRGDKFIINVGNKGETFDKVISTIPPKLFLDIAKNLPEEYVNGLSKLKSLGTINLILSLKESFLKEGSYWLNINDMDYPFLALVEHTNLIDKEFYNNESLLYVVNYLSSNHKYFQYNEGQLLEEYLPYLKKINNKFNKNMINKAWIFKSDYTQPVVEVKRSGIIPPFETPIEGLYICNMEQIYPWDRGTNYAINLGNKVAELVLKSKQP